MGLSTPTEPASETTYANGGDRLHVPLDVSFSADAYPRTAQQLAYEVLRRSILNGTLRPGTRLTQTQVASQLSLSTTPVREALRRLAGEELVRIDAHRGAIVRGLDPDELREIYELRLLLEPLGIRKAVANISEQQLAEAEALHQRMEDHSDMDLWSQWNREFHAVFARSCNSPNLNRILRGLRDSAARYVRWSSVVDPDYSVIANQEHQQLIDACRARDADKAAEIEREHLKKTLEVALAANHSHV